MMTCNLSSRQGIGWMFALAALCGSLLSGNVLSDNILQADESKALRRQRLESLSDSEKGKLLEKQKRFYALDPIEQQRLKKLHRDLSENSNSQRLHQISVRYNHWLGTLSSRRRAELLALPPEDRIKKIKEIMQQQESQHFKGLVASKLTPDDRTKILEWLAKFVKQHEDELLGSLPAEKKERIQRTNVPEHRQRMLMRALNHHRSGPRGLQPSKEEIEQLVTSLSPEAQKILREADTAGDKEEKIQVWIRAALFVRMAPQVSNEKLLRFFETLDSQSREDLEGLPKEEMLHDLRRMYYREMFRNRRYSFGSPYGSRKPGDERGPPRFFPPRGENGPRGSGHRGFKGPREFDGPAGRKRPTDNPQPIPPEKDQAINPA